MSVSKAVKKFMEEARQKAYEELDLQDQSITNIAEIPHLLQLRNVTTLILSHNRIVRLPDAIANCQGLENLNLFNNELESLPTTICNLPRLKFLNCGVNKLTELPKGFGACPTLEVLDLTYNNLNERSFSSNFFYLAPLRALYLGDNEFEAIPPEIKNLANLQVLVVRDNDITEVPKELGELSKLKELHLQHNRLRVLPPEIGNLDFTAPNHLLRWQGNAWINEISDQLVLGASHILGYLKSDAYAKRYADYLAQSQPPPPKREREKTSKKKDKKK